MLSFVKHLAKLLKGFKKDFISMFCQTHNAECPKIPIKCDSCGKKKIPRDKVHVIYIGVHVKNMLCQ